MSRLLKVNTTILVPCSCLQC